MGDEAAKPSQIITKTHGWGELRGAENVSAAGEEYAPDMWCFAVTERRMVENAPRRNCRIAQPLRSSTECGSRVAFASYPSSLGGSAGIRSGAALVAHGSVGTGTMAGSLPSVGRGLRSRS